MTNIITAPFAPGATTADAAGVLYQWDYGQILQITGLDLPTAYEVHFSNTLSMGQTITQIGSAEGVTIPDDLLRTGDTIYAWIYLHAGDSDGETEYCVIIPVVARPEPSDITPTPEQQTAMEQAIVALNDAVEATSASEAAAAGSASAAASSAEAAAASQAAASASEQNAAQSAQSASGSAETATSAAGSASASAQSAAASAESAYTDAERAEQAANTAGYLDVEIDENGHLIYTRTDQVDVDFSIDTDGHLIMEAI